MANTSNPVYAVRSDNAVLIPVWDSTGSNVGSGATVSFDLYDQARVKVNGGVAPAGGGANGALVATWSPSDSVTVGATTYTGVYRADLAPAYWPTVGVYTLMVTALSGGKTRYKEIPASVVAA